MTIPTYNILLLGPTQSGKSTFLESVKLYANPNYKVNTTRIGTGNQSCTQDVYDEVVSTNLPIYRLLDQDNDNRDLDVTAVKNEKALKKLLLRDDDVELKQEEAPGSTTVQLRFFDTPGLDDTDGNDSKHIAQILSALSVVHEFHFVILMDSHHVPLLASQKNAFKAYFGLFEELKGLITIVHTKAPNHHRYPGINPAFDAKLAERSNFFNEVVGREIPTKRIDCDLEESGPVHVYMTRSMIREILEAVLTKTPAPMRRTHIHKLPPMIEVDNFVHRRCEGKLDAVLKACDSRRKTNEAAQLAPRIEETKREIGWRNDHIRQHDTDERIQLFHQKYEEWVHFDGWWHDAFGRANAHHWMEFHHQEHTIDHIDMGQQGIEWQHQEGGHGHKFWNIKFKRHPFQYGLLWVTLYTTKRTKHQHDIARWRSEIEGLNRTLENQNREHTTLLTIASQNAGSTSESLEQLTGKADKYRMMMNHLATKDISMELFQELANADIYQGTDFNRNADALENHLARKFGIA
ncbi:MAG: hypothetical protein J3Q66DRAFT_336699 [Benniella sp.]|nr:MAG: hypothetical protein J3Q66DRAFT_336699 [Benniella sp.]